MPYLGHITISGPEPELERRQHFLDALSAAMTEGWSSPLTLILTEDTPDDGEPDWAAPERQVVEHRIIGYPGGAAVTVVMDGDNLDFEEAAAALASLGKHLTTWSPELLEYTLQQVEVSRLDQRWDDENWLPPLDHDEDDKQPTWPLSALMGDPLHELAAQYLVAGAVRSVWEPGKRVNYPAFTARDVALGAVDYPWHNEVTTALGSMLIQAAQFEAEDYAPLIVAEGSDRELAEDLLQRARLTAHEDETDGFTDDQMRGHLLLEAFMKDHDLDWKTAIRDEKRNRRDAHRNELLRQVLDAGFSALATMCVDVRGSRSPWELAAALSDDPVVAVIADLESSRIDEDIDSDADEVWAAAASHAAVWLAIHRPDLLDTEAGTELLDEIGGDIDVLHQVVHSALVMLGTDVLAVALEDPGLPPVVSIPLQDFVAAQRSIRDGDYDSDSDAFSDTHSALESALDQDERGFERLRAVLRLITIAAPLTATDANPELGQEGYISSPAQLSADLLHHADEHAALNLSRESHGDGGVRLATLAALAIIDPAAAGAAATQLPILDDEDPRSEPAARDLALRWIHNALELADDLSDKAAESGISPDAQLLLGAVRDGDAVPGDWPVRRLVAAAAEAAAALLQPISVEDADTAIDVFAGA